jgi:hypothetical protein
MIHDRFSRDQGGADPLVEGYYLVDLTRANRVSIPVRIWFGAPLDPETREEMDRTPRWQIQIGFQLLDDEPVEIGGIRFRELSDIWPACARHPIDAVDWQYRLERSDWAAHHDESDAYSRLGGRIDPMTCSLP